jgi:hypothetical protein
METSSGVNDFEYQLRRLIEELHEEQDYDPTFSDPEFIESMNEFKSHWYTEWLPNVELSDPQPSLQEAVRELDELLRKIPTSPERRFIPRLINSLRRSKAELIHTWKETRSASKDRPDFAAKRNSKND